MSHGETTAWSEMVDEEQHSERCSRSAKELAASSTAPSDGDGALAGDSASEVEMLRQQIAKMREDIKHRELSFQEKLQRDRQEFHELQSNTKRQLEDLEDSRSNIAHGAIPRLRLELEQADLILREVEA